jgi:hypothetical protein
MSKRLLFILIVLVILTLFAVVMYSLTADVTTASASDACWHGCIRPFKAFAANVSQCSGPYCGLYTIEPEPLR